MLPPEASIHTLKYIYIYMSEEFYYKDICGENIT